MTSYTIVVPTDFSEASLLALEPATQLARSLGATICLVHVVPELRAIPYGAMLAPSQPSPETPGLIARAEEDLRKVASSIEGCAVTTSAVSGENIPKTLARVAEELEANYIAISTHGHSNLRRILLGSVTQGVIAESKTPVILFPPL